MKEHTLERETVMVHGLYTVSAETQTAGSCIELQTSIHFLYLKQQTALAGSAEGEVQDNCDREGEGKICT